jgi:hypothetical protein
MLRVTFDDGTIHIYDNTWKLSTIFSKGETTRIQDGPKVAGYCKRGDLNTLRRVKLYKHPRLTFRFPSQELSLVVEETHGDQTWNRELKRPIYDIEHYFLD